MNCVYTDPVNLGSDAKPDWAYSKAICEIPELTNPALQQEEVFTIEHPTDPAGNFKIQKTYTYGDITTIFTLGLIALFLIFYILKKTFTHSDVRIHGAPTIKF